MPGRHRAAGGARAPSVSRWWPRGADPAPRRRARDARRVDLWARADRMERHRVRRRSVGRLRRRAMSTQPVDEPRRLVECTVDGVAVRVGDGQTILDACRRAGVDTPTLCWGDTLTPKNACRVCVVEVEGNRALVPA